MERTFIRTFIVALAIVTTTAGQNVTIRTIAGGYVGDGGLASRAGLYDVHSVAFDPDGTMYIADATNNRIRRVTPDGRIATVAGNGESGFKGDGGPGTLATFWQPQAVAVDSKGRLYVGDVLNRRVRRMAADGTMSTFAGDGTFRFGYDNLATSVTAGYPKNLFIDKNDVVYVIDADDHRVFKVDTATNILQLVIGTRNAVSSGDNGPAVAASTNRPYDVAVDSQGIVYVVEADGNRIRRIDKNGMVTTVCGDGVSGYNGDNMPASAARLNRPQSIWADGTDLYVADTFNNRIRRIRSGTITTIAGTGDALYSGDGGPAAGAAISRPLTVRMDPSGNLVISDSGNARIRRIDRTTGMISTVAGTSAANSGDGGSAVGSYLRGPLGVVLGPSGSGTVIFTDANGNRVRAIDGAGLISTLAGGDDTGSVDGDSKTARFNSPSGLATDGKGTFYVADAGNHTIRKIDPKGVVSTIAGSTQGYGGDNQPGLQAKFNRPIAVALSKTGELYISDYNNHCVRKLDTKGIVTTFAGQCGKSGYNGDAGPAPGATLSFPHALVLDTASNLLIGDTGNYRIRKVDAANGTMSTFGGNGDTTSNFLNSIPSIQSNPKIKPVPPWGLAASKFPFQSIQGLAFDSAGNLFVSQSYYVMRIDAATQAVTPVAGNCVNSVGDVVCYGYSGDNGTATEAFLGVVPGGIAVDSKGSVYLADTINGRVRTISPAAATTEITIATQPEGLSVIADGRQVKDGDKLYWIPGSQHQLNVPPAQVGPQGDKRYLFTIWGAGSNSPFLTVIAPNGPTTYTAKFKSQYLLNVIVNGNGLVTANPPADGGFYDASSTVQLTGTPLGDATFAGFNPAPDGNITMDAPKSVVAVFQAPSSDLSVTPGRISFTVKQGDITAPSSKLVSIASTGSPLTFGVAASDGYLTVQIQQNSTPAVARVSINPAGLKAGSYTPNLTIDAGGTAPIMIPIDVMVTPNTVKPDMLVGPTVLNLTVPAGTQSSAQSIAVTSLGSPLRLGWNVNSGSQWMLVQAEQNKSVTPATLDVSFSPAGLVAGVYAGRIEITSVDASSQTATQTVLVNLTVEGATSTQLLPSATGLTFQNQQKSSGAAVIPAPQTVTIASSPAGTRFYASASVFTSAQWLKVQAADKSNTALAPASLTVSVDPTGLTAASSAEGSIDLRLALNGDIVARIPVRLDLLAAVSGANLVTDRTPIQFHLPVGAVASPVVWKIQSPGADSVPVSVRAADGPTWLKITPGSTTAGDSNPALIQVSADSTGLVPGTYATSMVADAGGNTLVLPVTLTVTANPAALFAVQKSVTVTGKAGSLITRSLDLSASSGAAVNWQATSDSDWLRIQNASGTITPGTTASMAIMIDSSKLPVGVDTSGTIQITSPQTTAPEVITVTATAYSANQPPYLNTAGIVFTAPAGGTAPSAKSVTVTYPNHFGASATLIPADSWIKPAVKSVQTDGTLGQASFNISADPAGLAPGVYKNFVFVNFDGSTALNLSVVLVVTGAGNSAADARKSSLTSAACTPKRLIPVFASDIYGLHLRVGDTANTDFVLVDDCGNLLTDGAVSTNFSTADRPADLSQVQNGVWRSSWVPRLGVGDNGIQFSVGAAAANGLPVDRPDLQASIGGTLSAPLLDYKMPFLSPDQTTQVVVAAPGSRILINGTNLSPATIRSATGAQVLGNTKVTIGGVPMTLMSVSPNQIDALVPSGIGTNVIQSIVVSNSGSLSAPERIAIADFWPTVISAGMSRKGGLDLILTGIAPDTAASALLIRAGGQECRLSGLQPVRSEKGMYYVHATGCNAGAGQTMESRTRASRIGGGEIKSQATSIR